MKNFIEQVKNHRCDSRQIIPSDEQPFIGYTCMGCGADFRINMAGKKCVPELSSISRRQLTELLQSNGFCQIQGCLNRGITKTLVNNVGEVTVCGLHNSGIKDGRCARGTFGSRGEHLTTPQGIPETQDTKD